MIKKIFTFFLFIKILVGGNYITSVGYETDSAGSVTINSTEVVEINKGIYVNLEYDFPLLMTFWIFVWVLAEVAKSF